MKHFLILLSSITTLTISNSTFANFNQNTTFINNLQTNKNKINQILLINNQYGYLSNSDWITNQSTVDHKFYSYDTSALKDYTFANARDVFLVDNAGNLIYNSNIIVPDKDKSDIENTKQEMNSHKKITTIKNTDNEYSKSEYSHTYFSGDDTNWQYVQFGGIENHIDISQQAGGDKVEHSDNLSETLGLYYIAKAVRTNKISEKIADNLKQFFIINSTLKNKLNNPLLNKIINLIIRNNNVYKMINEAQFGVNNKNYSLNYVFDNNDNLIKVYINKWNNTSFSIDTNYHFSVTFNGTFSNWNDCSSVKILINWKKYFYDWSAFVRVYYKISFSSNSYISINDSDGTKAQGIDFNTSQINNIKPEWSNDDYINLNSNTFNYYLHNEFTKVFAYDMIFLHLCFWRDDDNIYYQWAGCNYSSARTTSSSWTINLKIAKLFCVYDNY